MWRGSQEVQRHICIRLGNCTLNTRQLPIRSHGQRNLSSAPFKHRIIKGWTTQELFQAHPNALTNDMGI